MFFIHKFEILNDFQFDGEAPPVPTRKSKTSKKSAALGQGDEEGEEEVEEKTSSAQVELSDVMPRIDISNQLTEALLNELSDKNWKVKNVLLCLRQNDG